MAAGDAYSLRNYGGGAADTSLVSDIGTSDTSFNITSGTGYPTTNFALFLDFNDPTKFEKVWVGNRSGGALTNVVRNADGSTAHAHSAGAAVRHGGMAQDFAEANAVAAALTTDGDLLIKGPTAATAPQRLARGSDHQFLRSRGASSPKLRYDYAPLIFATTTARDAEITAPVNGMLVVVTSGDSSDGLYQYNGTSWRKGPGWNAPWGVMGRAAVTASQTGISAEADLTSLTVTFTAVTGRRYKTIGHTLMKTVTTNGVVSVFVTDGSNTHVAQGSGQPGSLGATSSVDVFGEETISAGSVTRKLRAVTTAGTVDLQAAATFPAFILVEDIGPSGNPT